MKKIIIALIILALTGCKTHPRKSETRGLPQLSTDELCQSLGVFNDNGKFILKVYDELNKRTGEIDTERCFALEIGAKKANELNKKDRFMIHHDFLYPLPEGMSKHELNILRKNHKKREILKL